MTTLLRAPATLEVVSGTKTTRRTLPAGLTDISVPFETGNKPLLRLTRGNRVVLSGEGPAQIEQSPEYSNFYYTTGAMQ